MSENIKQWNDKVLKSKGVNHNSAYPKAIVKVIGDLRQAELVDGTIVKRKDAIYVDGFGLIKCAPYELHFIYELPQQFKGWGLMCTCGSIAGVVGYGAYSQLASPTSTGHMLVCVRHTTLKQNVGIGQHADGSTE